MSAAKSESDEQELATTTTPSALLTEHRRWLKSVIVARLGSCDGLEDVLQEVNVAAIEGHSQLRSPAAVVSWLYQIAVRQTLLFRRRLGRQRRRIQRFAETHDPESSSNQDPVGFMLQNEQRDLIQFALQQLSGQDRELLMFKYVDGWTYQQIAEHSGRTERAVESHLHRARGRLRERLQRLDVVDSEGETD